jgi:hypothetical protein
MNNQIIPHLARKVNIYFVAYSESDPPYTLAKQYSNANSKIKAEIKDATKDLEFAKKYDLGKITYPATSPYLKARNGNWIYTKTFK